jgi:hypothetical protein
MLVMACIHLHVPGQQQPVIHMHYRADSSDAHVRPRCHLHTSAYISIRQHTSAYVSIRQHTRAVTCTQGREESSEAEVHATLASACSRLPTCSREHVSIR